MKLRIHGNSIRFRITQSEMAALVDGVRLGDSLQFGPAQTEILSYAVEISPQCSEVRALFSKGMIQVVLPVNLARAWAGTDQVGIEHVQPVAEGVALKIVLEKDFQCFHPRAGENESDNFPNPQTESAGGLGLKVNRNGELILCS
jgi:hypothetical protein